MADATRVGPPRIELTAAQAARFGCGEVLGPPARPEPSAPTRGIQRPTASCRGTRPRRRILWSIHPGRLP
jgi:hypothetical protein